MAALLASDGKEPGGHRHDLGAAAASPAPPAADPGGPATSRRGTPKRKTAAEATYPFSEMWLRSELRRLVDEFGSGMAEKQVADPAGLLGDALGLLASGQVLVALVDGGVLVLPAARPLPQRHRPQLKEAKAKEP